MSPAVSELLTGALVTLLHLGALHAHEKVLVALVAFGPFVVLVAVVLHQRRRDAGEED